MSSVNRILGSLADEKVSRLIYVSAGSHAEPRIYLYENVLPWDCSESVAVTK